MKIYTYVFSMLLIVLIFTVATYPQAGNDSTYHFRTKMSGNWHDASTWETSPDSINWSDATVAPNHNANFIIIRDGDTVSILRTNVTNQVVVEKEGVIIVNGPGADSLVTFNISNGPEEVDMTVYGTIIATGIPPLESPFSINPVGVVSFEEGSVYEHRQDGGAIPIVTWKPGSTFKLTGTTHNPPFNRSQDYSNIIVDLPGLTFHLNMGFRDNVISGDITILSTGDSRWVFVGPVSDTVRTLSIMGDIIQYAGTVNTHATINPNSHAVIHAFGNINIMGGNFSIARADQGGNGTTIWYLHGDLSISNAVTQNANPTGAKFVFTGEGEHKLTLENVSYGPGGLPIEADSASLNIGSSVLGGNGIFTLGAGSELITSHAGGLNSVLQTTGTITLSPEAGYVFNGTSVQVPGSMLPESMSKLTVNNEAGVILEKDILVNEEVNVSTGNLWLEGHTITLGSSAMLNETDGLVKGDSGLITTTREINTPDSLNVAGLGLVITSAANLGLTTIERTHSPALINNNNGIPRQFKVTPANNMSLDATVQFYYLESELDTIQEVNLHLYSSVDGEEWEMINSTVDTGANYVEAVGLNTFAFLTLAYGNPVVSVKDERIELPSDYAIHQNYPNPFNPATKISFQIPVEGNVEISVFNSLGEKVGELVNEVRQAGYYEVEWNASALSSGVYFYRINTVNYSNIKKMILMK
jgi:hypothetical protein